MNAYESLAPHYDQLTADYDHPRWLAALIELAEPEGSRLLDVACGTGKSFAPLLGAGYEISACDISPAMLARARRRFDPGPRRLFTADMRSLPAAGAFDVITCLDDAMNYLLTEEELLAAFHGIARLLAPGGTFVFDLNTLATYRTAFASTWELGAGPDRFRWRGLETPTAPAGGEMAALVERAGAGGWELVARHRQRHHPVEEVVQLLDAAGLRADAVAGQRTGCRLGRTNDERRDTKTVFVARLDPCDSRR